VLNRCKQALDICCIFFLDLMTFYLRLNSLRRQRSRSTLHHHGGNECFCDKDVNEDVIWRGSGAPLAVLLEERKAGKGDMQLYPLYV
jgi:hypothetical protein